MKQNLVENDGWRSSGTGWSRWHNGMLMLGLGAGLLNGALTEGRGDGIPEPDLIWYGRIMQQGSGPSARLTAGVLEWVLQPANGGQARVISVALTNLNDQFSYVLRIPCETVPAGFTTSPDRLALLDPPVTYDRMGVTWNGEPLELQTGTPSFTLSFGQRGRVERLDLALLSAAPDSDGDGLPDWWESYYFGNAGTQPEVDSDGDGLSDGQEFLAGTNPLDPASVLAVSVVPTETGIEVQWLSVAGKTYRVLRSTALSDDRGDFTVLESGLAATPPLNIHLDTEVTVGPTFYLIQVEE
jgi:hypothetical protein